MIDSLLTAAQALRNAEVPIVLIIVGALFLALVGRFGAYVELPRERHRLVGGIGSFFLVFGVVVAVLPTKVTNPSLERITVRTNQIEEDSEKDGEEKETGPAPPPINIAANEVEPNDYIYSPNLIKIGQNVRGNIKRGEVDWFEFDTIGVNFLDISAIIRSDSREKSINFIILDDNEKEIIKIKGNGGSDYKNHKLEKDKINSAYVEVDNPQFALHGFNSCKENCWYEILINQVSSSKD